MSKDQSQNKKPSVRIGMIPTIAAVLLIIGIGGVFAKYIHDAGGGMLLSAREFYPSGSQPFRFWDRYRLFLRRSGDEVPL